MGARGRGGVRARATPPGTPHALTPPPIPYPPVGAQRETELWYSWFVAKPNFDASRVACWALSSSGAAGQTVPPGAIGGVQTETFLLRADSGEGVRRAFERLLANLCRR